ncbi:MAG: tRNA 2-thiouridine(34) synthase MnmA [Clostridia bacterium]|nr:tRNA 2-thiouridine(34) synthase MnmA [Clostridia bacterium]
MNSKKVLVAVSGGVDSGAAVYLLQKAGYQVSAIMLRLYDKTDENGNIIETEVNSARQLSEDLGIEFIYADYREEFKKDVIENFVKSYIDGKTPNPCVECNRSVKFRYVFDYAEKNGFDFIATGHYARVLNDTQSFYLCKAKDTKKDQSYVLYNLTQSQLSKLLLPLGEYSKEEVRGFAKAAGLKNYNKADSQDICFINGDYYDFIKEYTGETFPEGSFIDKDGNILGTHKGIIRYTIGQRKGLGLSFDSPRFVVSKNPLNNTVTLGKSEELFHDTVLAERVNILCNEFKDEIRCEAMVRYNQKPQPATAYLLEDNTLKVVFDAPQRAPSPGQSLVLYKDERLIGGGIIK